MASKKELMTIGNIKPTQAYRKPGVNQTRAGIDSSQRGFKRVDQRGDQAVMSNFLKDVMKTVPGAMDAWNKEANRENEKDLKRGKAEFKNATPKDRKKFRDAIHAGKITPDESLYFMEGLQIAHTETLTGKYGPALFVAYENWPDKLSNEEGAFDKFIEGFNSKWEDELSSVDDTVKADHWWPKQSALISQLSSQHQQKAAKAFLDLSKNKESEGLKTAIDSGVKHQVDSASDERSLSDVLRDEAEKGEALNEFHAHVENNFLKTNPQPFEAGKQKELITNVAVGTSIRVTGKRVNKPDPLLLEDSIIDLEEVDGVYNDPIMSMIGEDEIVVEQDAQKEIEKPEAKLKNQSVEKESDGKKLSVKDAIISAVKEFDNERDYIQMATFPEKKAGEQAELMTTFVGKKFPNEVYVSTKGGQVRLQFPVNISDERRDDIWTQVAKEFDYGYISNKDDPYKKEAIFREYKTPGKKRKAKKA